MAENDPEALVRFTRDALGLDIGHAWDDPQDLLARLLSFSEGYVL